MGPVVYTGGRSPCPPLRCISAVLHEMRCTACTRGHVPLFRINHPVPARRTGRKLCTRGVAAGRGWSVCICGGRGVRRRRRSVRVQQHISTPLPPHSSGKTSRARRIYKTRPDDLSGAATTDAPPDRVASITRVRRILAASARHRGHPPRVIYGLYDLFARNII